MDTDRPDDLTPDAYAASFEPATFEPHDDPFAADASGAVVAAAPGSRRVLAALAGFGLVLVGIVVWALLYAYLKRDYVGISVVFALLIGYVVREVSRRSDGVSRATSVVLTAVLCVVGVVVAQIAHTAREFSASFWDLLRDILPDTFTIVTHYGPLTYGIFVAALLVAYASAGPAKPKKPAATAAPGTGDPAAEPDA